MSASIPQRVTEDKVTPDAPTASL